jgi:hypothetical protein
MDMTYYIMDLRDFHCTCKNIICCSFKKTPAYVLQMMLNKHRMILCMQLTGSACLISVSLYFNSFYRQAMQSLLKGGKKGS